MLFLSYLYIFLHAEQIVPFLLLLLLGKAGNYLKKTVAFIRICGATSSVWLGSSTVGIPFCLQSCSIWDSLLQLLCQDTVHSTKTGIKSGKYWLLCLSASCKHCPSNLSFLILWIGSSVSHLSKFSFFFSWFVSWLLLFWFFVCMFVIPKQLLPPAFHFLCNLKY